jgi:hypothetical protein
VDGIIRHLASDLKKDDIVLIQWFENSIYFMLNTETGSMELPTRDEKDGIFHVTGKVTVSKDMQMEALLEKLVPLLAEYPENLKILLCPLVRYLEDCCVNHSRDEKLKKEDGIRQLKELYQLRRVLKSWIIRKVPEHDHAGSPGLPGGGCLAGQGEGRDGRLFSSQGPG